jgi:hypothetical protein
LEFLFFIPEDVIGAVGAIVWTLFFGSLEYFRQRRISLLTFRTKQLTIIDFY